MLYGFWRGVILALARLVFRVRVQGREHVPPDGAYVLAPSHRSLLDIPFAAAVTRRRLRFLAKQELFATRVGRFVFGRLGAVPVDRAGTDRAALRAVDACLAAGEPVVIFPEGTRRAGPELGPLFSGAAYLALKRGVPLVPVGIGGSEHPVVRHGWLPWWSRVTVVVGEPVVPPPAGGRATRSAVHALTEELRARLQACLDEANRQSAPRSGREARERV